MSRLNSIAAVTIAAIVAIAVSAGPALASTGTYPWPPLHHHQVPVGSVAGGLGVAAIVGIGLLLAQRRRRRPVSTKP